MKLGTEKNQMYGGSKNLAAIAAVAWMLAACATPAPTGDSRALVWPAPPEEPRYYYEATITGSNDILEETRTEWLQRVATGRTTRGEGMDKPFAVAARNGRVYVGDTVARKVAVFDLVNKKYSEIGTQGVGRLAKPLGIDADANGRLYVVDATAKRVNVYGPDGTYLTAIGVSHGLERPSGIAVNASGTRVYVVDTGGIGNDTHMVHVFDGSGEHLFDFGGRGTEPGQFNLPHMITVGADGSVYLVDGGNFRIQKFTADGKFQFAFGEVGRRSGQFSRPKGIAVDKNGRIFVADAAFGNIQIFGDQGELLLFIGARGEAGGPGQFLLPAGLAVDETGRIYVADQFFRKLEIFRPAGVPARIWTTASPAEPSATTKPVN